MLQTQEGGKLPAEQDGRNFVQAFELGLPW